MSSEHLTQEEEMARVATRTNDYNFISERASTRAAPTGSESSVSIVHGAASGPAASVVVAIRP